MHPTDFIAFTTTALTETCLMGLFAMRGPLLDRRRKIAAAMGFALVLNAFSHICFQYWFPLFRNKTGLDYTTAVPAAEGIIVVSEAAFYFGGLYFMRVWYSGWKSAFVQACLVSLFLNAASYGAGMLVFALCS